jgi:hypothetical protein
MIMTGGLPPVVGRLIKKPHVAPDDRSVNPAAVREKSHNHPRRYIT